MRVSSRRYFGGALSETDPIRAWFDRERRIVGRITFSSVRRRAELPYARSRASNHRRLGSSFNFQACQPDWISIAASSLVARLVSIADHFARYQVTRLCLEKMGSSNATFLQWLLRRVFLRYLAAFVFSDDLYYKHRDHKTRISTRARNTFPEVNRKRWSDCFSIFEIHVWILAFNYRS